MKEVLTFILAGGKGTRLDPLTRDRAKPAVPFGGRYRIIDFTLSNCINSELRRIYVLIQYKSFSLQKHLLSGWNIFSNEMGEYIDIIPAQQRIGSDWYKGTADAIYQNIYAIQDVNPSLILILSGDHIYKMNYRKMIEFHKKMKADMTVACVPMPKDTSKDFGVIEVDDKQSVCSFHEKPSDPRTIPGDSSRIFASMGIYLFNKDVLFEELESDARNHLSSHDFGKNIIPQMLKNKRKVYVHNFASKNNDPIYWRDIGTRDAYYQSSMDLLGANPLFDLYDKKWPVRTYYEQFPPSKVMGSAGTANADAGVIVDSLISSGCIIRRSNVIRSVISSNVDIHRGAEVRESILMEGVRVGENAKIRNAIVDKEVNIPPNARIGYDLDSDRKQFAVTTSGIVIVAKKAAV